MYTQETEARGKRFDINVNLFYIEQTMEKFETPEDPNFHNSDVTPDTTSTPRQESSFDDIARQLGNPETMKPTQDTIQITVDTIAAKLASSPEGKTSEGIYDAHTGEHVLDISHYSPGEVTNDRERIASIIIPQGQPGQVRRIFIGQAEDNMLTTEGDIFDGRTMGASIAARIDAVLEALDRVDNQDPVADMLLGIDPSSVELDENFISEAELSRVTRIIKEGKVLEPEVEEINPYEKEINPDNIRALAKNYRELSDEKVAEIMNAIPFAHGMLLPGDDEKFEACMEVFRGRGYTVDDIDELLNQEKRDRPEN